MAHAIHTVLLLSLLFWTNEGRGEETGGAGPLRVLSRDALVSILPPDTHLMLDPSPIEQFLIALDSAPPDWKTVYGRGHHDPGHDDRLFALNRKRDAMRSGRQPLAWRVTFSWTGELSPFNADEAGFPVAVGPKFITTGWGLVRFKPEDVPGNLVATAGGKLKTQIERKLEAGESVEVDVLMTGRLVPDESIIYDFSHDEEGLGLIMPFVRVERVDLIMTPPK